MCMMGAIADKKIAGTGGFMGAIGERENRRNKQKAQERKMSQTISETTKPATVVPNARPQMNSKSEY